jgi:hypothetical protein
VCAEVDAAEAQLQMMADLQARMLEKQRELTLLQSQARVRLWDNLPCLRELREGVVPLAFSSLREELVSLACSSLRS